MNNKTLSKLTIQGGIELKGTVKASGAKNAALPIMAACILLDGETELSNIPYLMDIITMSKMLNSLGFRCEFHSNNRIKIWNNKKCRHIAPYDLVTSMRASFFVAGPILAKSGLAKVPLPGGCKIGSRPIDLHLKGFRELGAEINIQHGFVELKAKKLIGSRIYLDFPSVGATENMMMAASLAEGKTIIENVAQEPEIEDLANFLISAGAKIEGAGTPTITVYGQEKLNGIKYSIIPDRIEAGSLLIAGAITRGNVRVENLKVSHLEPLIIKLQEAGVQTQVGENWVEILANKELKAVDIETLPFPGFPTDMQAQMMSLLTLVNGTSIVTETIFENRFMHAQELTRMGAKIKLEKNSAIITGVKKLSGANVKITDLRAGAALVLAGLAAEGYTTVYGLKHLNRGYERLPDKLRSLGAKILE